MHNDKHRRSISSARARSSGVRSSGFFLNMGVRSGLAVAGVAPKSVSVSTSCYYDDVNHRFISACEVLTPIASSSSSTGSRNSWIISTTTRIRSRSLADCPRNTSRHFIKSRSGRVSCDNISPIQTCQITGMLSMLNRTDA